MKESFGREQADDMLLEYYVDCFECVPDRVRVEPPMTPAQEARNKHVEALIKQQNVAKYRALVATKDALVRRGLLPQAMRLAEHLDRWWTTYAN